MPNLKVNTIILFFCVCCTASFAQTEGDDIIISNQEDSYTYKLDNRRIASVEEKSFAELTCVGVPRAISVAKFYDNKSTISKVAVKGIKGVTPRYEMYQRENMFYSDTKVCYFTLPFSRKEETAQVYFEKTYQDLHDFTIVFLSENQFVKKKTVKIVVPNWIEIDVVERNFKANIQKSIERDDKSNTVTYVYKIENEARMEHEDDMPSLTYSYPHLLIVPKTTTINGQKTAYFGTFDLLYNWYRSLSLMTNNDQNIIKAKSSEIVRTCTTDEEKIRGIFAWVQHNIRYIAFEYGIGAFKPADAQDVLSKKYGDCKGMSNLLKCMLKAEGFDASLVWIGAQKASFDTLAPLPTADHMICALRWNNKLYYLDPTMEYSSFGQYSDWIQGKLALIEDGDHFLLEQVPMLPASINTDSTFVEYEVVGNALAGRSHNVYEGASKQKLAYLLHAVEGPRRNDALRKFLEKGKIQDSITDIRLSGTDSQSDRLEITYQEKRKSGVQALDDELYIHLDASEDFSGMSIDTAKRKHDYLFPYKHHIVRYEYLVVPPDYKVVELPADLRVVNDHYSFTITYSMHGNQIRYHKAITVFDPWLKVQDHPQWNADLKKLKEAYKEQVVLKKAITN